MSQETINLIIGTIIGFFSSSLTIFLTQYLQSKRDEQSRKWQKTDSDSDRKRQIILKRVDQLEIFSKEIIILLSEVGLNLGPEYLKNDRDSNTRYYINLMSKYNQITSQFGYFSSIAIYLEGEVQDLFYQLINKVNSSHKFIQILYESLAIDNVKAEVDFRVIINEFNTIEIYTKLLKALDRLRDISPNLN